jgi:hypothetical protein
MNKEEGEKGKDAEGSNVMAVITSICMPDTCK